MGWCLVVGCLIWQARLPRARNERSLWDGSAQCQRILGTSVAFKARRCARHGCACALPTIANCAIAPQICLLPCQVHYQHVFQDQFPETRKNMMRLHAERAAEYEYLKPGAEPVPFDWDANKAQIYNVVDSVKNNPPIDSMRMVLVDGKWRLKV